MSLSRNELYRFDDFVLNRRTRTLQRSGQTVPLSPKAFEVLSYLVQNPCRVITKEELLRAVWPDSFVEEGNLAQHISGLRKALGDRAGYVVTVPGKGYQLTAEVTEPAPIESAPAQLAGNGVEGGYMVQTVRERMHFVMTHAAEDRMAPNQALSVPIRRRRWMAIAASCILAGGFAWLAWNLLKPKGPEDHHELVLAEFDNRTGEEVFDFILKNAMEVDLEQSPLLGLLSVPETRKTLEEMGRPPNDRLTPEVAREVCERNGAQAVVSGSIAALGSTYVLTLEATDCVSGKRLAKLQSQARNRDAILQSLGDLDMRMRRKLGESLHSIKGFDAPIERATTASFDALLAYSRAAHGSEGMPGEASIPLYQRAIQLDPKFAMAYEDLGAASANLGDDAAAREAFAKAYELRQGVSAREQFLITSRYYEVVQEDLDGAAKNLELWTGSYPNDAVVWGSLANTYTQMGEYLQAIDAGKRAISLRSNSVFGYVVLSRAYKRASRFDEAKAACAQARSRGLDSWHLHSILFQIAVAEHDAATAARERTWDKDKPSEPQTLDNSAWAAATAGQLRSAEALFRDSSRVGKRASLVVNPGIDAEMSQAEAELGDFAAARASALRVALTRDESIDAALGAVLAGDTAYAQQVVAQQSKSTLTTRTLVQRVLIPELQAAIALQEHKPDVAVRILDAAKTYELRDYEYLFLSGRAYLDVHDGVKAAAAYTEILANPGIDPVSPMYPLAHLGLARSYALQGNRDGSRKEYGNFLALWRSADQDLPVLKQARIELARLSKAP